MSGSYKESETLDLSEHAKKDGIEEIIFSYTEYDEKKMVDNGLISFEKDNKKWRIIITRRDGKKQCSAKLRLRKGIIHRHLNILYKSREVLKHALETKKWNWDLFEQTKMVFVRGVLPENICSPLRNALLKKEVLVVSNDFNKAFTGLFMLVSPLNSPAYNDAELMYSLTDTSSYAFHLYPQKEDIEKSLKENNVFISDEGLKNSISLIDIDNKSVRPECKTPILNELIDGITKGGMEQLSKAVSNLFKLVKEQKGRNKQEIIEFLGTDTDSAEFVLSLQKIL